MANELLDERINDILNYLGDKTPSEEEYKSACTNLKILGELQNEAARIEFERDKMYEETSLDLKKVQVDRGRNKVEIVRVVVPVAAGIFLGCRITKVEEVATVTSKALSLVTSFLRLR